MEASAAAIYWKLWRDLPVRFARRNPDRLGPSDRWRPGRSEQWLAFGPRASLLTGASFRATTPGNALLNYLYAILECEMTVALLAAGLDPGIGMFHSDIDGRSSLALDAIEALRPHVDYWLLGYLASSAFANRDFTELSDGEVRITHPLGSHLAHTSALWRNVCEPVANWLAQCLSRAADLGAVLIDQSNSRVARTIPSTLSEQARNVEPLTLPASGSPNRGSLLMPLKGALKDITDSLACWECGKALIGRRIRFCSTDCARTFAV